MCEKTGFSLVGGLKRGSFDCVHEDVHPLWRDEAQPVSDAVCTSVCLTNEKHQTTSNSVKPSADRKKMCNSQLNLNFEFKSIIKWVLNNLHYKVKLCKTAAKTLG